MRGWLRAVGCSFYSHEPSCSLSRKTPLTGRLIRLRSVCSRDRHSIKRLWIISYFERRCDTVSKKATALTVTAGSKPRLLFTVEERPASFDLTIIIRHATHGMLPDAHGTLTTHEI